MYRTSVSGRKINRQVAKDAKIAPSKFSWRLLGDLAV
jgi:hypothetical protein